ncbi:lysophospholipase [Sphingomonas cannabina]|uniref:alpha/beta hydrolase n=1 Tax=Sphingomonas cannabina TaxID=2899123 RepID=UPI001F23A4E8|nr:alpha/beta fold hydrolase [Sphingomonas cannabina]UIJ44408.1 lysophospholipase [Sphingomonas cannabina]
MRYSFLPLLLLAACAPKPMSSGTAPAQPTLYTESFGNTPRDAVRTLIVVLHGDAPTAPPSYQYAAARTFAAAVPESAVVAVLRPGYSDAAGHRSVGERGLTTGDNYTADRIAAVAQTIGALRQRYPHARTILVGHSGGAAIAADLAGTRGGLVDGLVLVGCPCMLDEWRAGMEKRMPEAPFEAPVTSLDPLKTVGGIPSDTRAAIIVGAKDEIAPPALSRGYAEALALRGIATDFRIVPGKGHEILDDPEVITALQRLAASLPRLP